MAVVEYLKDHPSTKNHNVVTRDLTAPSSGIITTNEECVMLRYLLVMHGSQPFPTSDCAQLEVLDRFARVSPERVARPSADLSFLAAADANFPSAAPRRGAAGSAA